MRGGGLPLEVQVNGVTVKKVLDLHAVGLPRGHKLHAYCNLDYTGEEISMMHEHFETMEDAGASGGPDDGELSSNLLSVLGASSNQSSMHKVIDGSSETYWQSSSSSKPHWLCLKLPEEGFDTLHILLYPFGGSYEPHKFKVRACKHGSVTTSSALKSERERARFVITDQSLSVSVTAPHALVSKSDLNPGEDCIYFEVHGCGSGNSGTDCKIRGFVASVVRDPTIGMRANASLFAASLAARADKWLCAQPESLASTFEVPYHKPTPPLGVGFRRGGDGSVGSKGSRRGKSSGNSGSGGDSKSIVVTWYSPDHDGGLPVSAYNVTLTQTSSIRYRGSKPQEVVTVHTCSGRELPLVDLPPFTVVTASVTATNVIGESAPSVRTSQLLRSDILLFDGEAPTGGGSNYEALEAAGYMLGSNVMRYRSWHDDGGAGTAAASLPLPPALHLDPCLQGISILSLLAASVDTGDLHWILSQVDKFGPHALKCLSAKDARKRSPLTVAATVHNFEAMVVLLEACHKYLDPGTAQQIVAAADDQGNTPLHYLMSAYDSSDTEFDALRRYMPLLEQLARWTPGAARNKIGETPLIRALNFNNRGLVITMLRAGLWGSEALACPDANGNTPLHLIAMLMLRHTLLNGTRLRGLQLSGPSEPFQFDSKGCSANLALSADCRSITNVRSNGKNTVRMLPAITSGVRSVTFVINRTRDHQSLGACYYVGIVSPEFVNLTHDESGVHNPPNGFGIEDDNSGGGGSKWQFPSSQTVDGRAFRAGDEVTIEVDFPEDTVSIFRNKNGAKSQAEGLFVHKGIPFKGSPVHFAITVYNTDATAEIVDDGESSAVADVPEGVDGDIQGAEDGVTDADKTQLHQLCEIAETLLQVPSLTEAENSDGHNPSAMILNMTAGIQQHQPWKPVASHTLEYTRANKENVAVLPTVFVVGPDGRSGTVEVGGVQVPLIRGPNSTTTYGDYDIELVAMYASVDVTKYNVVYHLNTSESMCKYEKEGDIFGSGGDALFFSEQAAPILPFGSAEISNYFFKDADAFLGLFSDGRASLGNTYDVLTGSMFPKVLSALRSGNELKSKPLEAFVRGTAIIYTQCFAQNVDIKPNTTLDQTGALLRENIQTTFDAFPELAVLELGECARALAAPLSSNTVLPLKLLMKKTNNRTSVDRPQCCKTSGTMQQMLQPVSVSMSARDAGLVRQLIALIRRGARRELEAVAATVPDIASMRTPEKQPLLHLAVAEKQVESAQVLLTNGVDVNATDEKGHTALAAAVLDGNVGFATMLAQHSAVSVNHTAHDDGLTPLHLACKDKDARLGPGVRAELVAILLRGGADTTLKTVHGTTARDLAFRYKHESCLKVLNVWPTSMMVAGSDRVGQAVECAVAMRVIRPVVPGQPQQQQGGSTGSARTEAAASAAADTRSFGTWNRRLPATSKPPAGKVEITMAEKLAMSVGRIVKELVRILRQTAPGQSGPRYESVPRQVFLSVTDSLWQFASSEMDYLEAHLIAGVKFLSKQAEQMRSSGSGEITNNHSIMVGAPRNVAGMADMYTAALLDTHNGGILGAVPCVDVSAYGHIAILIDSFLHALPCLHVGPPAVRGGGSEDGDGSDGGDGDGGLTVPSGRACTSSPFFLRSDSVEPYGAAEEELDLINAPVKKALPLATNPYLLTESRNDQFGDFKLDRAGGSLTTRHSARLSTDQLPLEVAGVRPTRQWSGDAEDDAHPCQSWETMVDFEAETALQSTFQKRWRTSIELMGSEFQKFFLSDDDGFFSGCLMSLLSIEAKQQLFKEQLEAHPLIGKFSAEMTVNRATMIQSSAKEMDDRVKSKEFPCRIRRVRFAQEEGGGEGVTRGWWSAVSRAVTEASPVFAKVLEGSAAAVSVVDKTITNASGAAETVRAIMVPTLPHFGCPHKNPIVVEWIGTPSSAARTDGGGDGGGLTFTKVDPAANGIVILSDGSKFLNPTDVNIGNPSPIIMLPSDATKSGGGSVSGDAPVPDLQWVTSGTSLNVHSNGTGIDTAQRRSERGSGGAAIGNLGFKGGLFEWEVTLKGGDRDVEIGVATEDVDCSSDEARQRHAWTWQLKTRTLQSDGVDTTTAAMASAWYETPKKGTKVLVAVDMDNGTVGFKSGKKSGTFRIGFTGLAGKVLFPFIKLKAAGNAVVGLRLVSRTDRPAAVKDAGVGASSSARTEWGRQLLYEPGLQGFFSPCYLEDSEWSDAIRDTYRFIGRFVGLALFNNERIPFRLSRHVIKYLMRKKVQWHDLAFFSNDIYEKMRQMIADPANYIVDGVNDTFVVDLKGLAGLHEYDLVPNGGDVEVTAENVQDYVEKAAMATMISSVERALGAMRAGFEDVFTPPASGLPTVLTPEDFTIILNGSPEIDTAVLRTHCQVSGSTTPEFIDMFWAHVATLSPLQKSELLTFWTGSACVPSNLSSWQLKLVVESNSDRLPTSATCFFKMRIPRYETIEEVGAKLGRAVMEQSYQQA